MHIGGKKRTERIDDERPIIVSRTADGRPIWIEAGSKKMTGDDKAALSVNLRSQERHGKVAEQVKQIIDASNAFYESVVLGACPPNVLFAYKEGDMRIFLEWLKATGFDCRQDGLTTVVTRRGQEQARFTAKVDPRLEAEIVTQLRKP